MLNIQLICVGKLKERFYVDAVAEYAKRLSAYCKLDILELPEERTLEKDAENILAKLHPSAKVVALCVEGKLMDSPALAAQMEKWAVGGESRLAFLIGGSTGLDEAVKARAALRLSMSPMTFPHHLARVMVLEQLYRAFKISEGSAYHK